MADQGFFDTKKGAEFNLAASIPSADGDSTLTPQMEEQLLEFEVPQAMRQADGDPGVSAPRYTYRRR